MWKLTAAALAFLASAQEADEGNSRPLSRIVKMLQDMQVQMQKEQEEDEKVYDELACWCSANNKEKTQAIKDAETTINQLTGKIESLTAQSGRLSTEIANLGKEISANNQSLDKATALRRKALAAFTAEEKDLVQSISSLKSAIIVLSKHHESSLLQEQEDAQARLMDIASVLRTEMDKNSVLLQGLVTPKERRMIKSFISDPSYSSQSGEIFGIMTNMLEEFQRSLADSQKTEAQDKASFEELKKSKLAEIAAAQEQFDAKTSEKANADERNAQSKNERADTKASLSADEEFLLDLKEKCKQTDEEWEQRTKSRQEEVLAISQAIGVLSADDARDNFAKTVNTPSFLQVVSNKEKAAQFLIKASKDLNNPHLAVVASRVRLDAFTKVKAAIDEMIKQLDVERQDEIKHKDWCVKELNTNKNTIYDRTRDRDDAQTRIDSLAAQIKALTDQINTLKKQIADLRKEVSRGGEDRERANNEFQVALRDQRTTQKLLNKAKDILAAVYDKKSKGVGFVQDSERVDPPTAFKTYEKKDGGGVIGLLNQIITDSKAVEAEVIHDEEKQQESYESFIRQSNKSIDTKSAALTDARAAKAKNEQEKSDEENNHAGLTTELEQLTNNKADIHKSCDFVLKNFDIRQKARAEESDALRQAKQILSGSNFKNLLQKAY